MMDSKKVFLILIPGFAKDETDTTCLPFHQLLVTNIKKRLPHLHIIVLSFQYPFTAKEYTFHSIPIISFGGKNKNVISKILLRRKIYNKLDAIHKQTKISGILSFWLGECAFVGNQFSKKHSIPHYCWLMGQDAKSDNKYVKKISPSPASLIALSDFLQTELEKNHGICPKFVIPPGIDTNSFENKNLEKDIDLLAVGSLIPLKQFEIFIELVPKIKKEIPAIKAMLIGDGPERENLNALIKSKNLQSNIILSGELSHPDVIKYMQRTKVFIHPSSYEGFGIVCIEALYAGAHVISFVKPMNKEIPNWLMAESKEDMLEKTLDCLQTRPMASEIPFSMDETAKKILLLFDL